mmetsp:Transcript_71496/g.118836  ORF Transcript_71496/g.118836 Transcript_71496/m.118836 type:complete len:81 (-) Transcript_71496:21-263(-)
MRVGNKDVVVVVEGKGMEVRVKVMKAMAAREAVVSVEEETAEATVVMTATGVDTVVKLVEETGGGNWLEGQKVMAEMGVD